MIAFLMVTSALALDSSSLRSAATSDLFRDPYDFIPQPGLLAVQDEKAVVTVLNAYGAPGRYSLGYLGGAGKGVFGAVFDLGMSGSNSNGKDYSETADFNTTTTTAGEGSTKAWSGVLSYGVPLSDSMAFGLGLRIDSVGGKFSYDPQGQTVGGDRTQVDYSEGDDYTSRGVAMYTDRGIKGIIGGSFTGETNYFALHVTVRSILDKAEVDAGYGVGDTSFSQSGYVPGTAFRDDRKGLAPGVLFEGLFGLSDTTSLRINLNGEVGKGGAALEKSTQTLEQADATYVDVQAYRNAEWHTTDIGALAALYIDGEDLSVRPGLWVRSSGYAEAYTPTTAYDYGDLGDGSSEYDTDASEQALALGIPLAVEVPLGNSEIWTLRMAGEWTWTKVTVSSGDTYEDKDAETLSTTDSTSSASSSALNGSFGLRFWPVDGFRMDAAAYNGTSFGGGGSDSTDVATVWLSATLLIP